jgi:glutamate N-acetyltransferase/amino-acid N-acetyltransferase
MPMRNVAQGIRACSGLLKRSPKNARDVAEAIMTSDTRRKEIAVEFKLAGKSVRIGGVCKGAGMIQPQLTQSLHATMLAFITTDVLIESGFLKSALKVACGESFNRITVDGDMSTNDTVIVLANGLAGNLRLDSRSTSSGSSRVSPHRGKFQEALNFVCLELAKMIVRDGEGISRVICLRIRGARNSAEAEAAARAVANSALVKTSWCGGDPNWGRILCAIGYSSARIDESKVDIGYSPSGSSRILFGCRRGQPTGIAIKKFAPITTAKEFDIHVDLHRGRGEFVIYASDLTEDYVSFNKGDITDPSSLGG